jgi:hypothetical protein
MSSTPAPALRRAVVTGGVAVAFALGAVSPATAVDIVEGDTPVVLSSDQSAFGAIPEVFPVDGDEGPPPEIDLLLFGGPSEPEITPWTTTALSFDSENRVYVALLSAGQIFGESVQYLCAIRVYDDNGVPLGSPVPVANPDGGETGLWPVACTGLALLDVLSAYGLDLDFGGGVSQEAAPSTAAFVYFSDGTAVRIDARTGTVTEVLSGSSGSLGDFEALAISAGPAGLLDPERSGLAVIVAGFTDEALIVSVLWEGGETESRLAYFPVTVDGAEFDSELNLWLVSSSIGEGQSAVFSFSYADLSGFGFEPTSTTESGADLLAPLEAAGDLSAAAQDSPQGGFQAAAISGGYLVSDLGAFPAGGIAIERDAVELAADAEEQLAATGADDQLVLTVGIIAGALLIGGVVISAIGASRRRTRGE